MCSRLNGERHTLLRLKSWENCNVGAMLSRQPAVCRLDHKKTSMSFGYTTINPPGSHHHMAFSLGVFLDVLDLFYGCYSLHIVFEDMHHHSHKPIYCIDWCNLISTMRHTKVVSILLLQQLSAAGLLLLISHSSTSMVGATASLRGLQEEDNYDEQYVQQQGCLHSAWLYIIFSKIVGYR